MTKHTDTVTCQGQADATEIEITPEMVRAGLDEMREHQMMEDMSYVLECVYRAMAYARA